MKYTVLTVLFLVFSCKDGNKATTVADVQLKPAQTTALEVYDFAGLEPFLNKNDGKTYVVNFWATWCAPCVKEMPFFEKIREKYADKNVEVILVSLDFPRQYDSKLKPFIVDKNIKSKVVALNDVDSNSWIPKVSEDWTGAIPATLIYNKDKRQFYEQSFDYEELETQIQQFIK